MQMAPDALDAYAPDTFYQHPTGPNPNPNTNLRVFSAPYTENRLGGNYNSHRMCTG